MGLLNRVKRIKIPNIIKNDEKKMNNSSRFIGDKKNGEVLFNAVGCMGCHQIDGTTELRRNGFNRSKSYKKKPQLGSPIHLP